MKILRYLLLLFAVVNTSNCKRTCENVKVGELEYSDSALSFFNYTDGEKITFASSSGNTREFTVDLVEEVYFICQKITCDPLDPYKSSYCEYLEAPQNSIFLTSDTTLIALTVALQNYEPESDLIYEYVNFTLSHNNDSAIANYINEVRFTEPVFDSDQLTGIDSFVQEKGSITMNDQTFTNVLISENEQLTLVYQKGIGFVGFSINGEVFTLE